MADVDWDDWLDQLIENETARRSADVRTHLIAEISRALARSGALGTGDPDRLAEIAVDAIIESTHKNQIRPS